MRPFIVFFILVVFASCGAPPEETNAGVKAETPTEGTEPDDLIDVKATYEYAKEMKLDSIHRFEFVISKNMSQRGITNLAPTLENSETLQERPATVGEYVSAELIDPSQGENFDIVPLSIAEQTVLRLDSFACLWQWDVRPLKKGSLPLRLKVQTRLDEDQFNIPVFDTNIEVYAEEVDARPWIFSGVGLGILALIAFLFFKNKKRKAIERVRLPESLALEIKKLVGDGENEEALELLETHLEKTKSNRLNDVIVLQSTYREAKRKNNLNVLSNEDFRMEISKVNFALLDIVKELS